jgi:hypothetical protein
VRQGAVRGRVELPELAPGEEPRGEWALGVASALALLWLLCTVLCSVPSAQVDGWLFPSNKCCPGLRLYFPMFLLADRVVAVGISCSGLGRGRGRCRALLRWLSCQCPLFFSIGQIIRSHALEPIVSLQPQYSLLCRGIEWEVLQVPCAYGCAFLYALPVLAHTSGALPVWRRVYCMQSSVCVSRTCRT